MTNVEQLTAALKEGWALLSVNYFETLISGMGRRYEAVIEDKGSTIKYYFF